MKLLIIITLWFSVIGCLFGGFLLYSRVSPDASHPETIGNQF
jgi:hypothetical protein